MRQPKQKLEIRKENKEFFLDLSNKAKLMGGMKVPKFCYIPHADLMITAKQEANAIKIVRQAYNNNPDIMFQKSFRSWAPKSAADILRWEVTPFIHERINIRALMN